MFRLRARSAQAPPSEPTSPQSSARPQPLQLLIDRGEPFFEPYGDPATDWRYNLAFCDIPLMFQGSAQAAAGNLWAPVFDPVFEPPAVLAVAQDPGIETLFRVLAYHRLRTNGICAPLSGPLATIIEMPQTGGLDTLAIYAGGTVRYINQSRAGVDSTDPTSRLGQLASAFMNLVPKVLASAKGPIGRRQPPPSVTPEVRISILSSDGCRVLEGPEKVLETNDSVRAVLRLSGLIVVTILEKWREQRDATRH